MSKRCLSSNDSLEVDVRLCTNGANFSLNVKMILTMRINQKLTSGSAISMNFSSNVKMILTIMIHQKLVSGSIIGKIMRIVRNFNSNSDFIDYCAFCAPNKGVHLT